MFNNPSETYSIEMILMDEQGTKMQGNVLKKWFSRFEKFMKENATLIIQKPTLGDISHAKYKYVENPIKICLNWNTQVKHCNAFDGPKYGFNFTTFQSILENAILENATIDVIGHIVKCFKLEIFTGKDGKESKEINLIIEDLQGLKIYITLWGVYAQEMFGYLSNKPDEVHVVIILQFGVHKFFEGCRHYVSTSYSISNTYSASRLLINKKIDEIINFKKSLLLKFGNQTSSSNSGIGASMLSSDNDEFLKTEFNNIAEVNGIMEVKSVIIVGTIKHVTQEIPWFYYACKVTRKFSTLNKVDDVVDVDVEEERVYVCTNSNCNAEFIIAVPRFKIPIRVQDYIGVVSLNLFEREARRILKKYANDLLEKYLENNYKFFGISKMCDDPELICELQKKFNIEEVETFDSIKLSKESGSEDTVNLKDVVSYTGDNTTPLSSVQKSTAKSQLRNDHTNTSNSPYVALKRNLGALYDLEESGSTSTTKKPLVPMAIDEENGKHLLLIPKIEK
ncbi:hypothetical protein E3N88_23801 [Mikania micrantha]|uniref:Replication protein A 70 kDa DNA-binding subunit B/D first OB fold domain-containing protein n=1 Tax=Mikania micrantha TaxID=192012 RepID=A0A5N6NFX1_9ASTR|nr:hypothetical protein E3N88_23801 [Mikania micrantha]